MTTTTTTARERAVLWDDIPSALGLRIIRGVTPYDWGEESGAIQADSVEVRAKWLTADLDAHDPVPAKHRMTVEVADADGRTLRTTVELSILSVRRDGDRLLATYEVLEVAGEDEVQPVVKLGPGGDYVRTWP